MQTALTLPRRRLDLRPMVVVGLGAATLLPWISPPVALLGGVALALTLGNPFPARTRVVAQHLLTGSVVGLGAGMDLGVVLEVGLRGLGVTALGIAAALALGTLLGRLLGVSRHASLLVTLGTAICGGSAIAAAAPALGAADEDVSVALVTVFVLNAVALLVFPAVGQALALDPERFGLWCALAIHDTSSVVGAASQAGERALEVATSAKLARALWIVPVTFGIALHRSRQAARRGADEGAPLTPRRPWFIAGFLAAAALVTALPVLRPLGHAVADLAHRGLASTLFVIGLGMTRSALRSVGVRPLLQGVSLWVALALGTLVLVVRP